MSCTEQSVLQVLESYKAAVHSKNVDAFVAIYDENALVFDAWGRWSYQGIGPWRAMAKEWFESLGDERVVVEFEDIRSTVISPLGCVSAVARYTAVSPEGTALRSLENRLSLVMQLKSGEWKVVHEHTSFPADHGTLKVSLKRALS